MLTRRCNPYYDQDGVTIYHGDALEVLEEWDGLRCQPFDLLLTDPPYGIYASGGTWGAKFNLSWDRVPASGELLTATRALARYQIIWGGNYFQLPPSRCWLAWLKPDRVPTTADFELAWTNFDANARSIQYSIAATNPERNGHPTIKPEAVMRWALLQAPATVQTVLDPFMGSGTTLVAAKRLGRQAVGIEREERYCEIAARRLSQGVLALFDSEDSMCSNSGEMQGELFAEAR